MTKRIRINKRSSGVNRSETARSIAAIFRLLESKVWISRWDVVDELGCCVRTAERYLNAIRDVAPLIRDKDGAKVYYKLDRKVGK